MTIYAVYLRGREVELSRFAFLAEAEVAACDAAEAFAREAYVIDTRASVYAAPVYRVRAA